MQPIPRILSEKIKIFSQFFAAFLKSTDNFEQCEKKKNDELQSLCVSKVIDGEKRGYINV